MSVISAAASRPVLPGHLARLAHVRTLTKTCINHCTVSQHKSSHNKRLANTRPDLQPSGDSQSTRTIHSACSECCCADGCRNSCLRPHKRSLAPTRNTAGRRPGERGRTAAVLPDLALHSRQGASATSVSNQRPERQLSSDISRHRFNTEHGWEPRRLHKCQCRHGRVQETLHGPLPISTVTYVAKPAENLNQHCAGSISLRLLERNTPCHFHQQHHC